MSDPSKLVIFQKWKSRIALFEHNAWEIFPDRSQRQKHARFALSETRPILFGKIPGGIFERNETQTNPES